MCSILRSISCVSISVKGFPYVQADEEGYTLKVGMARAFIVAEVIAASL